LKRRDTWSGKTIHWPVEGTSLMVPVDLAALPTYTRSRDFDGFRGFGIVRLADAVEDPHSTGLTFVAEAAPSATARPEISEALAEAVPSFSLIDDEADEADDALTIGCPAMSAPNCRPAQPKAKHPDQDTPAADTLVETKPRPPPRTLRRASASRNFETPTEPPQPP
jgi:hypothetical protein